MSLTMMSGVICNDTPFAALVLMQMKNGKGLSASQLNPKGFVSPVRLAIPQMSSGDSLDLLATIGCEVFGGSWTCAEGSDRRVIEELVKLDLQRYCADPAPGDADKFCEVGQKGLSWSRARHGGSVVLLKKYDAPRLPPAYEGRKVLELFVIENDQRRDLK